MTHKYHPSQQDKQTGHSGKVQNDTNKLGKGQASQTNEGQRTPESRHDREDHIGNNQVISATNSSKPIEVTKIDANPFVGFGRPG